MARMSPDRRREAIVDAALAVARRKGLAGTTVRDVAHEMGTSSGLIHHYFDSMDEVLRLAIDHEFAPLVKPREGLEKAPTEPPVGPGSLN